ncbi:fumarylacetoacetate hydrolase family protein [Sphingobium sp. TomTYG45]
MKLASVDIDGSIQPALVRDDGLIPLGAIVSSMQDLIAQWPDIRPEVEKLAQAGDAVALDQSRLRAPIGRPGKLLAIGLNYADHIIETGLEAPTSQVWFCKHVTAVNAPFAPVHFPKVARFLDFEVELVAIVGRRGRHIPAEKASNHIFGFCVGNDFTARDWQFATHQWMLGKSFDTHAPFGPWITTVDEVGDPHALSIRCQVNGTERQRSNTRELVFNIWDQVAHLSEVMTLEPGDVIFTGTPGGVGWGDKPPQSLSCEDIVRCEIEKLGFIENRIVNEA